MFPRHDPCFVLRFVNDVKALSHKYIDAKGRSVFMASRDKFGYSNFKPTQKEFKLFLASIIFREESDESSANSYCAFSVRWHTLSTSTSNGFWIQSNLLMCDSGTKYFFKFPQRHSTVSTMFEQSKNEN